MACRKIQTCGLFSIGLSSWLHFESSHPRAFLSSYSAIAHSFRTEEAGTKRRRGALLRLCGRGSMFAFYREKTARPPLLYKPHAWLESIWQRRKYIYIKDQHSLPAATAIAPTIAPMIAIYFFPAEPRRFRADTSNED